MNESSYLNREIDEKFGEIHGKLDSILAQTTKTNGRVNALENWRWLLIGGMTVVTGLVIPLVITIWNQNVGNARVDEAVSKALEKTLSAYNIEVQK